MSKLLTSLFSARSRNSVLMVAVAALLLLLVAGNSFAVPDPLANWHWRSQGDDLYGVAYGNGKFVAVGGGGTVVTSPDMVRWTKQRITDVHAFNGVIYANSKFVAVADYGDVATSTDGPHGLCKTTGIDDNFTAVTYGNGKFVAVCDGGTIATSPDGVDMDRADKYRKSLLCSYIWKRKIRRRRVLYRHMDLVPTE